MLTESSSEIPAYIYEELAQKAKSLDLDPIETTIDEIWKSTEKESVSKEWNAIHRLAKKVESLSKQQRRAQNVWRKKVAPETIQDMTLARLEYEKYLSSALAALAPKQYDELTAFVEAKDQDEEVKEVFQVVSLERQLCFASSETWLSSLRDCLRRKRFTKAMLVARKMEPAQSFFAYQEIISALSKKKVVNNNRILFARTLFNLYRQRYFDQETLYTYTKGLARAGYLQNALYHHKYVNRFFSAYLFWPLRNRAFFSFVKIACKQENWPDARIIAQEIKNSAVRLAAQKHIQEKIFSRANLTDMAKWINEDGYAPFDRIWKNSGDIPDAIMKLRDFFNDDSLPLDKKELRLLNDEVDILEQEFAIAKKDSFSELDWHRINKTRMVIEKELTQLFRNVSSKCEFKEIEEKVSLHPILGDFMALAREEIDFESHLTIPIKEESIANVIGYLVERERFTKAIELSCCTEEPLRTTLLHVIVQGLLKGNHMEPALTISRAIDSLNPAKITSSLNQWGLALTPIPGTGKRFMQAVSESHF